MPTTSRIEEYLRKAGEYERILALHVNQTPHELGESRQAVALELLNKSLTQKLVLRFSGVKQLRIADVHPDSFCYLNISSIIADQLEGLRYRVFNSEQDLTLSFFCFDFEIFELSL